MNRFNFNSREHFLATATTRLLATPEPPRQPGDPVVGDHRIAGLTADPERIASATDAAVLIPLVFRPAGGSIILTQRSAALRKHSGQVAFPGGRCDPGETPLQTALREAEEEIGLAQTSVRPIGFLPAYYTGTGYRITPTVSLVEADVELTPNPDEVDRIFELPLDTAFDMRRFKLESRMWEGQQRHFYVVDHADAYIWGATAALIRILYERLTAP